MKLLPCPRCLPRLAFVFVLGWLFMSTAHAQSSWPEFRGPTGQGVSTATQLPLELSVDDAVWKQEIPGRGWSSPVITDGRVFLTTAVSLEDEGQQLEVLALNVGNGEIQFRRPLFETGKVRIHSKNSHASPTPIIRDRRVYVHFGPHGTACLDFDGKVLWKNEDLDYPPVHGNGGSPILVDDRLIFSADGASNPSIIAVSAKDGSLQWRQPRPTEATKKFSFSTPLAVEVAGKTQVISAGSDMLSALDSRTGEEIWRVNYNGYSVIPRPIQGHGMVFLSTSYDSPSVLAVKLGGVGDVTESHVAWTMDKGAPHTPSMVLHGDDLFMVSDRGVATCVDARTGVEQWKERLDGNYSASPLLAAGRLYFFSEQGDCSVVTPTREFKLLAKSSLGQRTLASPAVVESALVVRTETHLYRFE